jgi:hypothetical protein
MKSKQLTITVLTVFLGTSAAFGGGNNRKDPVELLKKAQKEANVNEGNAGEQQKKINKYVTKLLVLGPASKALGLNKSTDIDFAKFNQAIQPEIGVKVTYGEKKEIDEAVDLRSNVKNITALTERNELKDEGLLGAELYVRSIEFLAKNSGTGENVQLLYKFNQIHHDLIVRSSTGEVKELKEFNEVMVQFLTKMYQNKSQLADVVFMDVLKSKLGGEQQLKAFIERLKNCLKV